MSRWWGVDHRCEDGLPRVYPTLHWEDEPDVGAGPREWLVCDDCGGGMRLLIEGPTRQNDLADAINRLTPADHLPRDGSFFDGFSEGLDAAATRVRRGTLP